MRYNPKIKAFLDKLAAAGVSYRIDWSTRRDGKPLSNGQPHHDVHHIAFTGNGFKPTEATAILLDYDGDGFGLYLDSGSNSIDADVVRIAAPRAPQPVAGARELAAKLQEAVDAWPQFDVATVVLSPGCIPEELDEAREVNGGDMVEWFGNWRSEARALLGWRPPAKPIDAVAALYTMRRVYGRLHDFLSDAIEGGRLRECDIPDDYQAIVRQLEACTVADDVAGKILGGASDAGPDLLATMRQIAEWAWPDCGHGERIHKAACEAIDRAEGRDIGTTAATQRKGGR